MLPLIVLIVEDAFHFRTFESEYLFSAHAQIKMIWLFFLDLFIQIFTLA